MPFVSTLKESFALASHEDRQRVVEKQAVPNTVESYYYQGLVILKKIHDQVHDPQPRSPTSIELELAQEMKDILSKLKAKNDRKYYPKLEARFQLLAYPFQTGSSVEYLQKELSISNHPQPSANDSETPTATAENSKLPTSLDPALIDGTKLIQKAIKEYENSGSIGLDAMSFPYLTNLTPKVRFELITQVLYYNSADILGINIVKTLASYWKSLGEAKKTHKVPDVSNLTLAQMDELMDLVLPDITLINTSFIRGYLMKLVPATYYHRNDQIDFWDDHNDDLKHYLNRADAFAERLPPVYRELKASIKFYQLRIDVMRQDFSEHRLIR
jgi:hypothetical protein